MAKKTEDSKNAKSNKNIIIGICIVVLVLAVIIVAIVFSTKGNTQLNDAYFVSDSTKYVLTVDEEDLDIDDRTEHKPVKTHIVYPYSGDNVTGMITYLEYADESAAKAAFEAYKDYEQSEVKNLSTNGKYLVVEMTEDQYSDLKASDVKQQIEFMEMLKNIDSDKTENAEDAEATKATE